jgi:hypothetical protein
VAAVITRGMVGGRNKGMWSGGVEECDRGE